MGSSQESQVLHLQHSSAAQPVVATRSPVQLPRARSLDSGARRRFYPVATSRQMGSQQSLSGCSTQEKLANKRRSFPSPQSRPRMVDVPVRMCSSQQLVQMAKQRPLWLQKVGDMVPRSKAGKGTSPSQCARLLKD